MNRQILGSASQASCFPFSARCHLFLKVLYFLSLLLGNMVQTRTRWFLSASGWIIELCHFWSWMWTQYASSGWYRSWLCTFWRVQPSAKILPKLILRELPMFLHFQKTKRFKLLLHGTPQFDAGAIFWSVPISKPKMRYVRTRSPRFLFTGAQLCSGAPSEGDQVNCESACLHEVLTKHLWGASFFYASRPKSLLTAMNFSIPNATVTFWMLKC